MSTGARVQFIRVAPTDEARMTSWIHHVARLTGTPVTELPDHPVFVWQLLAANHRVLARGSRALDSLDAAKADVAEVVAARDELSARMVRLEASRGYGWMLLHHGEPVLISARWYTMERNRRESLTNARVGLGLLALGLVVALAVESAVSIPIPVVRDMQLPLVVGVEEPA